MPTPTDQFWNYFEPILNTQRAAEGVKYVQLSDANRIDRVLEDARSEDVYPGIFVMRPTISGRLHENYLHLSVYETLFYIFVGADTDDRTSQDDGFQKAERIAANVLNRLQEDGRTYINFFEYNSLKLEPVVYNTGADYGVGYEVKIRFGLPAEGYQ